MQFKLLIVSFRHTLFKHISLCLVVF